MNGKNFNLEIIDRDGIIYAGKCDFVVVPTTAGEIGILTGHTPLMSVVSKGQIKIYKDGVLQEKIKTQTGFVEVMQDCVNILAGKVG